MAKYSYYAIIILTCVVLQIMYIVMCQEDALNDVYVPLVILAVLTAIVGVSQGFMKENIIMQPLVFSVESASLTITGVVIERLGSSAPEKAASGILIATVVIKILSNCYVLLNTTSEPDYDYSLIRTNIM